MSSSRIKASRRQFLKSAGRVGGILSAGPALPTFITSNALGNTNTPPAGEGIRVACVGLWTMGKNHLHQQFKNTIALCDVEKRGVSKNNNMKPNFFIYSPFLP